MAIKFLDDISVSGSVISTGVTQAATNTNQILVSDGGIIKYRTNAEIRSDIGAGTGNGSVTSVTVTGSDGLSGTGTITTSGTITLSNSDKGSSQFIYKNITADSGGIATANSNNDTITITGGTNVSTVRLGDTITINATDTDTNNYVSSVSWNTTNGILTLNRLGLSALTVDLDGRYVTSSGVTSVSASHAGDAFSVSGSPITSTGTIAITLAGSAGQYINGAGNLTTFPSIPQGDITAVTVGPGLTGGGTSGAVSIDIDYIGAANAILSSKDLIGLPIDPSAVIWYSADADIAHANVSDLPFTSNLGTVTNVGISHAGNAFTAGSAVSTSGTLAITMAGTAAQYVNGQGNLITFPAIPQGDITSVVAGSGMTGGGTSGAVTLNVIGGTGITANADNITIDATVATLAGTQTFTNKSGNISQWTNDSAYITAASLPTVSDATITFAAGTGLTGGGAITLNQAGNATVTFNNSITNNNQLTNGAGYTTFAEPGIFSGGGTPTLATGVTAAEIRSLIGAGTSSSTGTVTSVIGTGSVSGLTLTGTITTAGNITLGGSLSLTSGQITTGLGFTPYNATNPSGFTSFAEPGIFSGGGVPTLATGVTADEVRTLIGAGTSSTVGTVTSVAATNGTGISVTGGPITTSGTFTITNTAPDTGIPAILSNGATPSLNTGITAAEIRSLIGAGTSSTTGTVTSIATSTGLSGGTITGSGTLTNTDRGTQQNIFKNFVFDGESIKAASNDDAININAGANVNFAVDLPTNTVTINSTDTNTNYYLSSASFNTTNGVLTLNRSGLSAVTVDLDGRYVTSSGVTSVNGSTTINSSNVGSGSVTLSAVTGVVNSSSSVLATGAQIQTAINNALTGVLSYQGTWDAAGNIPNLNSGEGTPGYYYIVSVAGATNLDGITDWEVGDWAVFSDLATDAWQKIDNTQVGNVTGSGSSGRVAYWNSSSNITSSANMTFNGADLGVSGIMSASGGNSTEWNSAYDLRSQWNGGATNLVAATGRTSLGLGTLATLNSVAAGQIDASAVNASELNVVGNGTTTQFLRSDGDGSFTWATPINTQGVTSVGGTGTVSGLTLTGSVTSTGNLTLGGTLSLTSANVTGGLGFTPYNATNPAGYTTNTGTTTPSSTETFTNKSGNISQWTNDSGYTKSVGDITEVVAGTNLTGGGTSGSVTINMATGGAGAGVYGSTGDTTKIDTITLDAYGRVTAVGTGLTGDITGVTAGTGLSGGGTSGTVTLTNSDTGSSQTIFKHFVFDGSDFKAENNDDSVFVNPGSNITFATDPLTKTVTINANTQGDITGVTAGTGLSGGGTSGTVTLTNAAPNVSTNLTTSTAATTLTVNSSDGTNAVLPAATTTVAGVMTGADKAKLNGIATGATNVTNNNQITNGAGYITSYVNTTYSAGSGLALTGTVFSNTSPNIVQTTVSGNAGSATILETGRTIAGVKFDGSADIALNNNAITNGAGYITAASLQGVPAILSNGTLPSLNTGITAAEVRSLIGAGTSSTTGTVTSVGTTGTVSGLTLSGTVTTSGNLTLGGTLVLTSANVTTGLGFTPYNSTNPAGYTTNTGTTTDSNTQTFTNKSGNISQWTNDSGYTTNAGDITAVLAGTGMSGGGTSGSVTLNCTITNNNQLTNGAGYISGTVSAAESVNTIAQRNASGYLHASYFNGSGTFATSGAGSGMGNFTGTNGTDTYGRSYNAAAARTLLNVEDGANRITNNNQISNGAGYITSYVNTTYTAGSGITLTGTVFSNAAPNIVQTTVSGNAGSATVLQTARTIAGVSFNGSANISLNNNAITNGAGYITSYVNTTYTAGTGLALTGTVFSNTITNNNQLTNGAGYITSYVNTTYTAGAGLALTGTVFSNTNIITNNNQLTNGAGYTTNVGDITGVTAGTGLSGGGTSGTVTLTNSAPNVTTNLSTTTATTTVTVNSSDGTNAILPAATTSAAGVMTSDDRKKLDGIASGATNVTNNNQLSNGAGYTSNVGDITSVGVGNGLTGGGTSGAVTVSMSGSYTGNFTATGNLTAYSDERLKTNIETIPNALEKVNSLRGVTFDKDGERGLGVIAQEVEKILPEVVIQGEEYKSVAYGNIVGVLIEAIKELTKEVEELKRQIK